MLDDGTTGERTGAGSDADDDTSIPRVQVDGGRDPLDATSDGDLPPVGPCHLVERDEPFRGVAFDNPSYSFTQSGLLARGDGTHVVQYGPVAGVRTGDWQDPPIFAAEYDISTWPPTPLHAPTQLFHSMHMPSDLIELPNGKLALSWWFDNDGPFGPMGVRFRTLDANTWALDADRFLVEEGSDWTRPEVGVDQTSFASAYRKKRVSEDGARYLYDDRVGVFGFDGSERKTLPLWDLGASVENQPLTSMRRAGSTLLLAAAFGSCEGVISTYCEPYSLVVFRVGADDLQRVTAIPLADPSKLARNPSLLGDRANHTWLVWWETDAVPAADSQVKHLLAQPLATDGTPSGPLERWLVEDEWVDTSRQPASVGSLGIVYPVSVDVANAGHPLREVRLLHRQLDQDEPLEAITFTSAVVSQIETVQLTAPRRLLVGYSTRDSNGGGGSYGELRSFVCREDLTSR